MPWYAHTLTPAPPLLLSLCDLWFLGWALPSKHSFSTSFNPASARSTPLLLSLCDWWFLGRALPNMRSWICLFMLLLGAAGYVFVDTAFHVSAYYWLAVW